MGVHRTCGEPDEIELTPIGVKLNGSRRVPVGTPASEPNTEPTQRPLANEPSTVSEATDACTPVPALPISSSTPPDFSTYSSAERAERSFRTKAGRAAFYECGRAQHACTEGHHPHVYARPWLEEEGEA